MTVAEYAAHRGCSDSYVRRMRRERRLVCGPGKLIDVAASDALLDATSDPVRGGDRTGKHEAAQAAGQATGSGVPTATVSALVEGVDLREAMRRERLAKAQLAELELGEQSRDLTRVKQVDREVFTLVRQALERMRTIGSRIRGKLAAESDARACEALVDAEVRQVAEDMQAAALALFTVKPVQPPAEERDAA